MTSSEMKTELTQGERLATMKKDAIGLLVSVAALVIVAMAFFWPDAMEGNVLMQHDTQQGIAISHESEQWRVATGETPRWTNALFSGMPTFQISPSYPSGALIKAVEKAYSLWLPEPANLLFIMMVGFLILLLSMRIKWPVALIGAVGYGLSSYFVIIIGAGHLWKFITLAYIPPTIAGMVLAYRGRYLAGGAMAAFFAMLQIAGNHIQMSYYFMIVVVGFAVAYLVILLRQKNLRRWLTATGVLAVAALLAVMANAPSLYNTYEYSKETMRGRHSDLTSAGSATSVGKSGGLDKDYITAWSYGKDETFTLLIPNVKGGATIKPEKGSSRMLSLGDTDAAADLVRSGQIDSQYAQALGQMPQYFGDQPMTNGPVYVGALLVALFLLGCVIVKGPVKWMLIVVTLISIFLSWGHNMMWLTDLMIDYFPMYNKFRTVASILVVAEFTIPLLAMLALSRLIQDRDRWRDTLRRPFLVTFGLTLFVCLLGVIAPSVFGHFLSEPETQAYGSLMTQAPYDRIFAAVESVRMAMVSTDALRSFIIVAIGGVALWFYMERKLSAAVMLAVVGGVVLVDMFTVDKRYVDSDSFMSRQLVAGDPFPLTAADREILADTSMNYRVMNIPEFTQPGPSYHHKTIGGYHAAKLTRYQDMIDCHLANFTSGKISQADLNVLNMLNARYIVTGPDEVIFNPDALGNAWFVDRIEYVADADEEMAALDTINPGFTAVSDRRFRDILGEASASAPGDTIFETSYAPDKLTYRVRSAAGGVAVFSEIYFPWGWSAEAEGRELPIGRVDYLLRAVRLPAGEYTLTMEFNPRSVGLTVALARVAILIIYVAVVAALALSLWVCRKKSGRA